MRAVWRYAALAALLPAAIASSAQDEGRDRVVRLSITVLETLPGEPTRGVGGLRADLRPGEGTGALFLTPFLPESGGRCSSVAVTSALAPPGASPRTPVVWSVEAKLREASLGGISLEYSWKRLTAGEGSDLAEARSIAPEVISLRVGERILLDLVDRPVFARDGCARSLALELTAAFRVDEGLEAQNIAYELWMIHQPPAGPAVSRVWKTTSIQGEKATFRFPSERLGPPAGWGAQDDPVELIVEIDGDIRGWLRPDGALDLVLSTYRDLVFADGSSAFGETGFKAVRVEPGEAVRLVLPGAPGGKPGDGRYAGYLEGHAFSLILVARPQP